MVNFVETGTGSLILLYDYDFPLIRISDYNKYVGAGLKRRRLKTLGGFTYNYV